MQCREVSMAAVLLLCGACGSNDLSQEENKPNGEISCGQCSTSWSNTGLRLGTCYSEQLAAGDGKLGINVEDLGLDNLKASAVLDRIVRIAQGRGTK